MVLIAAASVAQDPPPTDRQDAIQMLQGTSSTPQIDPERIARVETWLGKVRRSHPEVREIHARMGHVPGMALVVFRPEAEQTLARARWAPRTNRWPELEGSSGIGALDDLQKDLGATLHRGPPGLASDFWQIHFDEDFDVPAVCRCYRELSEVQAASPNLYAGDGDEIVLKTRGSKLLMVFKHGWGDCPAGCINNHFFYFEVDTVGGTLEKRGELEPSAARGGGINLWGVPARFAVAPFANFDAVLKAASHRDWWVALHAVEVTGTMLAGRTTPWLGEDSGSNRTRFDRVRNDIEERRREACSVLLRSLEHEDPDVRERALWHLRSVTKLQYGGDGDGIRAWRSWLRTRKFDK